ncbi:DNA-directed RNA polymerase subunit omega [Pseudomonas qingdaonensis]|nr:DNA-directed RNA polymerase subunit omega [Pseudomonas qingdaonensis]
MENDKPTVVALREIAEGICTRIHGRTGHRPRRPGLRCIR